MNDRRNFLKKAALSGIGAAGLGLASTSEVFAQDKKKKATARNSSGKLRVGFIGVGSRAQTHMSNVLLLGAEVVAICDTQQAPIARTKANIAKKGAPEPKVYTGSDRAFEDMLSKEDLDAVIISSPWEWHVPMSVASMKAGVPYTGVEVSAANTLEECWDLVNVSEQTGNQVMILENVCYRSDVMSVLNMVREGLFGELLHCRCGYEHDLRNVKFNDGTSDYYKKGTPLKMGKDAYAEAQWRTMHSIRRNGDLYPTHGIGPVGGYLDINRGNRFTALSAMATKSLGLNKYIVDNGGANHPYAKVRFNCGDIVTSMIQCANGETVIVTHDTNSPRPYSLGFRVQGTEGLWYNDGNTIYIEGKSTGHNWEKSEEWIKKYEHELWREHGERAKGGGHGGMDYVMMFDFLDAVKNKKHVPLDAYDAAAWSAISALSEMSIAQGGGVVDFPDFTRGQWIRRVPTFANDTRYPIDVNKYVY